MQGAKFAFAETFGIIALFAVLFGYIYGMGRYWIYVDCIFLMPVTIVAYLLFTWLSQKRPTPKGYWIMYSAKIAVVVGLLLLSPVIGRVIAGLVNG